jgi:hypothetical protein
LLNNYKLSPHIWQIPWSSSRLSLFPPSHVPATPTRLLPQAPGGLKPAFGVFPLRFVQPAQGLSSLPRRSHSLQRSFWAACQVAGGRRPHRTLHHPPIQFVWPSPLDIVASGSWCLVRCLRRPVYFLLRVLAPARVLGRVAGFQTFSFFFLKRKTKARAWPGCVQVVFPVFSSFFNVISAIFVVK